MKRTITFLVLLALAPASKAELQLNELFTDNMVLQRNQKVLVWGTADPGADITADFGGQKHTTKAGADGRWRVQLEPMKASSTPRKLSVFSSPTKQTSHIKNVLVGDVWVLAGQSNMARELRTYSWLMKKLPDLQENDAIRWFKITPNTTADEPSKKIVVDPAFEDSWQPCSRKLLPTFSPAGYFFAIHRYEQNKIPLGLIYAARGATRAESWVPMDVLKGRPEYAHILDKTTNRNWKPVKRKPNPLRPTALYNGTVHPLIPFTIKGVLWYQGESDSPYPDTYTLLFPELIRVWRKAWGQGDFPFIFAQISSCKDRAWSAAFEPKESAWAWQREAQAYGLNEPNTAMIATHDVGEWEDIHPQNKNDVGKRFALAAAALGGEKVVAAGPVYKSHEILKDKVVVSFDHIHGGLRAREVRMNKTAGMAPGADPEAFIAEAGKLTGFTICGADRVFHESDAVIEGDKVVVSSPKVKEPVAVRYAWATFALANLYSDAGLPAYPFRSDTFPMPILMKKQPARTK